MRLYWLGVIFLLAVAVPCQAETPVKESGKEIGQGFKKIGKETGAAFKEGGKEVGQGFKNLGKETGQALKEGGKESAHAAKKSGKSVGDWFRGLGHSFKRFFNAE